MNHNNKRLFTLLLPSRNQWAKNLLLLRVCSGGRRKKREETHLKHVMIIPRVHHAQAARNVLLLRVWSSGRPKKREETQLEGVMIIPRVHNANHHHHRRRLQEEAVSRTRVLPADDGWKSTPSD